MRRTAKLLPLVLLAAVGCGKATPLTPKDQPSSCYDGGKLDAVGQCVDCTSDADCVTGQKCNLITGKCEIPDQVTDAGHAPPTCQVGAVRCGPGLTTVQTCVAVDGGGDWQDSEQCTGGRTCNPQTLTCAICIPGETICDRPDVAANFVRCADDGTGFDAGTCAAAGDGYTCHQTTAHQDATDGGSAVAALATCRMCQPNSSTGVGPGGTVGATQDFHDGGVGILSCDSTGSSEDFESCYPTFQFATYTDGGLVSPLQCKVPLCYPGTHKCTGQANTGVGRESCNADGSAFVEDDCTGGNICGPTPTDRGACLNPCEVSDNSTSYVGCDYWGLLMSNSELDPAFSGNVSNQGAGTAPSQFAFVVGNTSASLTAHIGVTTNGRFIDGGTVDPLKTGTVYLPWQEICGTGTANFGYHLTSDVPVTVYQFNPLASKVGSTYSYTNDASLLLPTHLLGTSYVVVAQDEESLGDSMSDAKSTSASSPIPGTMAVVATEDGTQVTIHFAGAVASTNSTPSAQCGTTQGNLAGVNAGGTVSYSLSKGQVLHFWNAEAGSTIACASSAFGDALFPEYACLWPQDFTGSIVTSTKPVAVFGGADCTTKPYNQAACDHIEEEMFPFNTWGKSYVGVKSKNYADSQGGGYSDYWRIVSGCGTADCPNGTTVTITPAIDTGSARASASCGGNCSCVTSGATTTCKLPAIASGQTGPWLEFTHHSSFVALSDQPTVLAQYFVSESQAGEDATTGDPSLVLSPPIEQWRSTYTVLAPTTYATNFVSLMVATQADTANVQVDGTTVTGWSQIGSTSYYETVYQLSNANGGSHSIIASNGTKVGVVVYGYDSYVSYGYTGGLDLQSIVGFKPPQ